MRVVVNGEERQVPSEATVRELLAELGLAGQLVAVERNAAIVPRAEHGNTTLREGDEVEVVHFVGGG
jgi:sulfur carrier protein